MEPLLIVAGGDILGLAIEELAVLLRLKLSELEDSE